VVALILVIHAVFLSNRSAEGRAPLSLWALYHSGLSVLLFLAMLRVNFEPVDRVLLPALSAVGLLATLRGHKVRELAVMGLLLMLAAHLQMLLRESFWIDWPLPLALAAITGVYANYWLRDTMVRVPVVIAHIKQAWFSLAELLLLTATLLLAVPDPAGSWLWILLFLMVVMPLRANFLGSAWPAWAVQVYLPLVLVLLPVLSFPSLAQYTNLGPASGPHWWALLGILCVSQAVARLRLPWRSLDPGELSLQAWSWWKGTVRVVFPWVASAVYVGWVFCELPRDYWMLTFGLSALALGLFSSVFQRVFLFRLAWGLSILSIIFSDFHVTGWDALGMLAILLFQITSRYLDKSAWGLELPRVVPRLSVSVALVVLFVFVSREVLETADFALTMTFGV
jgi:hypothetical protein